MITLLLTQMGCAPNATTYYRPSIDGGQVLPRHCVPTESIVEFGTLPIQASVIEGHTHWVVEIGLPARRPEQLSWQTFHFANSDFYIRDLAGGTMTNRLEFDVVRDDKLKSVVEPYVAKPDRWLFTIYVELPDPPPENFEFVFPRIVIDGQEVESPPIQFERKIWMGISPFNC